MKLKRKVTVTVVWDEHTSWIYRNESYNRLMSGINKLSEDKRGMHVQIKIEDDDES